MNINFVSHNASFTISLNAVVRIYHLMDSMVVVLKDGTEYTTWNIIVQP